MGGTSKKKGGHSKSFEETVLLSGKGPETVAAGCISEDETIAMPTESGGLSDASQPACHEKTIAVSIKDREQTDPPGPDRSLEDTLLIVKKDVGKSVPKKPDTLAEHLFATDLERKYYKSSVKRGHSASKYKFQEKLVSGGMGAIFTVLDQDLQRTSAMKVILPTFKSEEETLKSFITEAKITGMLEHPNIIPVHEIGLLQNAGLFFTMKLAKGEALSDVLTKLKKGKPEYIEKYNTFTLLGIFRKVCDALSFAHSKEIIHQDIKPHNIMVGEYGEVLLMDWGLAKFIGNPDDELDPVIRENLKVLLMSSSDDDEQIRGSPTYMSPEQTTGDPELLDKRTDIFLLGATLYHMFTFESPYMGNDIYEVLFKAENATFVPPEEKAPGRQIPEEICRIIKKAMGREKTDRYQTVEELARDIDDLISGKWTQQEKKLFDRFEMLMKEGETGDEAYLILKGKVQVFKERGGNKIVLGALGQGDIVGEMALISREPRSASVEALIKTEVAVLTKGLIAQHLKKLPPFMEKIVSTITERLQTANTLINPHSTSDSTYFVLEQLRLIFKDRCDNKPKNFSIPLPNIVQEISENLGIPRQQVKKILIRAKEQKYIDIDQDTLQIPLLSELAQYTKFGKLISRLPPEKQEVVFETIKRKGSVDLKPT